MDISTNELLISATNALYDISKPSCVSKVSLIVTVICSIFTLVIMLNGIKQNKIQIKTSIYCERIMLIEEIKKHFLLNDNYEICDSIKMAVKVKTLFSKSISDKFDKLEEFFCKDVDKAREEVKELCDKISWNNHIPRTYFSPNERRLAWEMINDELEELNKQFKNAEYENCELDLFLKFNYSDKEYNLFKILLGYYAEWKNLKGVYDKKKEKLINLKNNLIEECIKETSILKNK